MNWFITAVVSGMLIGGALVYLLIFFWLMLKGV